MLETIKDIFRYAHIAYKEPNDFPSFLYAEERLRFSNTFTDTDYAFAVHEPKRVVIAFRGTDTKGGNWKAWISNLKAMDRFRDYIDPGICDGFGAAASSLYSWVEHEVKIASTKNVEVILTGHSRGSAIAGVTAYKLMKKKQASNLSVIGFATPNWCNKKIRNEMNLMQIDYTNANTDYDIVPNLPPTQLGFRRPGKDISIKTNALLPIPCIFKFSRGILDHTPEAYLSALKKTI